jgi:biopolymer transport protein ExbB/TolQ
MQSSPYGLASLWTQGDMVTKAVACLLLAMSIASWYVIVTKALQLWRYRRAASAAGRGFWDATSVEDGLALLSHGNPFADIAQAGVGAMRHHNAHKGHLHDQLSLSDWATLSLRQAIDEASGKLQIGMAVLASVGSTAPFVGLFGTVWGIYHALVSIGVSGQAGIDRSPKATSFAKNFLQNYSGTGIGSDAFGNPISKPFSRAGTTTIYAGAAAADVMGVKPSDDRVPDLIGVAQYGVVWAGSKLSKIAEHGGNAKQDRDVPIVVWGSSVRHLSNDESVETTQSRRRLLHCLGWIQTNYKQCKLSTRERCRASLSSSSGGGTRLLAVP